MNNYHVTKTNIKKPKIYK